MSNLNDIIKTQQKIIKLYNPILQSVNQNILIAGSNALIKPMHHTPALQASYVCQKSCITINEAIRNAMSINYSGIMMYEPAQAIVKSVQTNINLANVNIFTFIQNYESMISGLSSIGYNLSELVQQAYDEIEDEEFIEDDFSSNEEIAEVLQEQIDDPKGFQERVADWSEAKKNKYYILIGIIFFIWTNIFQPYFQETIGKPVAAYTVSKVKELSKEVGKVIDILKKDFQAIITEDVPYYYKVTYTDEKGNVKEGYVAKKNLKIIEAEEGIDNDVEETE